MVLSFGTLRCIPNRSAIKSADTLTCLSTLIKVRRVGASLWSYIVSVWAVWRWCKDSAVRASDGSIDFRRASSESACKYSNWVWNAWVSLDCRFHGLSTPPWSVAWIMTTSAGFHGCARTRHLNVFARSQFVRRRYSSLKFNFGAWRT